MAIYSEYLLSNENNIIQDQAEKNKYTIFPKTMVSIYHMLKIIKTTFYMI